MSYVWLCMVALSLIYGTLSGNLPAVSAAALDGAGASVRLCLGMCGAVCMWCGLLEVMRRSGLMEALSSVLYPILSKLLPESAGDRETMNAVTANVAANLLGLGSAATPMGVRAATRMARGGKASDDLCRFTVLNTASVQLIPATVAAVRYSLGSAAAFDIIPAVLASSAVSVTVGLAATEALRRLWSH